MAAVRGIINSVAEDVAKQAAQSVVTPTSWGTTPSTTVPPKGIIAGAQGAPGMSAPATPPAPKPDYTSQIQDFYQKDFGRQADAAGLDYWNKAMGDPNMSLDQVHDFMRNSDEYKALHPPAKPASEGPTLLGAPMKWGVTADQTVQGQMKNLVDPNNPFYQQWATAGAQDAAARGFTGNSSIRSTGIMDSVMRGATPIATSDASTYAKAAGYNADMPNQFAIKNQDASNSNSQFNTAQQNDLVKASLSADTQKAVASMSAQTQRDVAAMNNASQATISQAHDANAALLASNDAAKSAYSSYVAALAQIDQNDKMDGPAKQAAIITQTQIFNNAIAGLKAGNSGTSDISSPLDISHPAANPAAAVGGVDVSNILDFGG